MYKLGKIFTTLGILCLTSALFLLAWNKYENCKAADSAGAVMSRINEEIDLTHNTPDPYDAAMTEKEIDGVKYVGCLSIPELELNLPIALECSNKNLKISPCRYFGSSKSDNLVIAAHNYSSHFGSIKSLKTSDEVVFTDMDGLATRYAVTAVEVLNPTAVKDMTSGEYDLTLFTCTYDGENRVTVRCDKKN